MSGGAVVRSWLAAKAAGALLADWFVPNSRPSNGRALDGMLGICVDQSEGALPVQCHVCSFAYARTQILE